VQIPRSRKVYTAQFKMRVVQFALRLPESNRIKPTARAHPGVEPVQVRKWLRKHAEAMGLNMGSRIETFADYDVSECEREECESTSSLEMIATDEAPDTALIACARASARKPRDRQQPPRPPQQRRLGRRDEDDISLIWQVDTSSLDGDEDAEVVLASCSVERPLSRTATSETTNASSHSDTPLGNAGSPRDASYRAQSPHVPLPTAHAPADQKPFDWDTRMAAHELLFLGAPHGIPE
jgi:transposase-like protein